MALTRRSRILAGCAAVGITALAQAWFWSSLFRTPGYFAQSDLYEEFLPQFLAPLLTWSAVEFAGMPVFADPQNAAWYPVQLLARAMGSWSLYIASAYVIAGAGASAYAWQITRSRVAAILAGLAWPWSEAMVDLTPHFAMLHGFAWLPWALFGLERIAETRSLRWAGATACIVACFGLAGHPQVSVYGGYLMAAYALCLWSTSEARPRVARLVVTAFAAGGMLAAVQLVPTLSLADWIARSQVGFAHFADGFTKQPHELMAGIIPQFCHERRETPQYAGLLPLLLASVALVTRGREWRVRFWMAVAVVGLLLGLGSQTPLAELAYHMPLYDRFRVVARHLALAVFAIVMLGALGAAAVREGRLRGWRVLSLVLPWLAILGGLAVVRARPDLFQLPCDNFGLDWLWGGRLTHVGLQAALASLSTVAVLAASRAGWWRGAAVALPVLLTVDLLSAQAEPVDAGGFFLSPVVSEEEIRPSVHAERIRADLASTHQRLLPLEGSATDAVVPGMFARLWNIPSLGGYNPLLPDRLHQLTRMNNNGSVGPKVLLYEDTTLDLFAVKYVLVRASELAVPAPRAEAQELPALDALVGPSDCRARGPMSLTLGTVPVEVTGLVISARMRCADNVAPGARIGTIVVGGEAGRRDVPLIYGTGGEPGQVVVGTESDTRVTATFAPLSATTVTIEATPQLGTLAVDRLGLRAMDGSVLPLTAPPAAVATDRWQERRRFATARETDRGRDRDGPDEVEYVLLENTRALPRVWFTGQVFQMPEEHAVESLWFGRTRDGSPLGLDARAFVDDSTTVHAGGGTGTVTNVTVDHGRFTFDVTATTAGLAIVSELHHPSWRASVDGVDRAVVRADYALVGVPIPAGRHRVILTFQPGSFTLGAGISLAGCIVVLACVIAPVRRRKPGAAGPEPRAAAS